MIAALLALLGVALLLTNPWFSAVDDEIAIIDKAARPVSYTIQLFLSGAGEHEHPPLWDLILHGWLRITGGDMHLIRLLPILFYLAGAWALLKAARRLGGAKSEIWLAVLIVLWPYGFHFGRLAAWYSFGFFAVSLLTWAYLSYVEEPTSRGWAWVFLASLALIYANYFGWAILACVAVDFLVRNRRAMPRSLGILAATVAALVVLYLPVLAAFLREVRVGPKTGQLISSGSLLAGAYNLYALFVSESVAPWVWVPGVMAGAAVLVVMLATLCSAPVDARRFFWYFLILLAILVFLGVVSTKRVMLIGAWLLLPIATALGPRPASTLRLRRALLAALAVIACVGWYGIFARNLYAAPRWVEPWQRVAEDAASVVRCGGVVIGDNPGFFFYLTYLAKPSAASDATENHAFAGLLPYSVHHPGVFTPQQWLEANRPIAPTVLFTNGVHFGLDEAPIVSARDWLDQNCHLQRGDRYVRELGKEWKDRYSPQAAQPEWRVEVRRYACGPPSPAEAQSKPTRGGLR